MNRDHVFGRASVRAQGASRVAMCGRSLTAMLSILLSVVLTVTMVPAAALAAPADNNETIQTDMNQMPVEESTGSYVISGEDIDETSDDSAAFAEDEGSDDASSLQIGDDAAVVPAGSIINQTMPLETVAQQESTRSYFLAQTLESTKTIPVVSASLPLDTSMVEEVAEPDGEAAGDGDASEEGGEDSDEPDLGASSSVIAAESIVIGAFEHNGITYAVEPGGETVAVVAVDYAKLPEEFIEARTIVLPSTATPDGIDHYSVTRIADNSFASLNSEALALRAASAEASEEYSSDDSAITAVTVPASISQIDEDAFIDFDTLQYIIVSGDNSTYASYDGALYGADQTNLLLIPGGRLGAVRIAPSIESLDPAVFSHTGITEVGADADSAAFQLLSANDLYNANGDLIAVSTEPADDSFDLSFYEELMEAEETAGPWASAGEDGEWAMVSTSTQARIVNAANPGASWRIYCPPNSALWRRMTSGHDCTQATTASWKPSDSFGQYQKTQGWYAAGGGFGAVKIVSNKILRFTCANTANDTKVHIEYAVVPDTVTSVSASGNLQNVAYDLRTAWVGTSTAGAGKKTLSTTYQWAATSSSQMNYVWIPRSICVIFNGNGARFSDGQSWNCWNSGMVEGSGAQTLKSDSVDILGSRVNSLVVPDGYTFIGWGTSPSVSPDSNNANDWWYKVGQPEFWRPNTGSAVVTNLYAIWRIGYDFNWNTSYFGGAGTSITAMTEDTSNIVSGEGADIRETAVITDKDLLTSTVRFPAVANDPDKEGIEFLGWTCNQDGTPPDDNGYFRYEDGDYTVTPTAITNDSRTLELDKTHGLTWYAVWTTKARFAASEYGGRIIDDADGITDWVTVYNNRPVPADDRPQPAVRDASSGMIVPGEYGRSTAYDADRWSFAGWTTLTDVHDKAHFSADEAAEAPVPDGATTFYGAWECGVSWVKQQDADPEVGSAYNVAYSAGESASTVKSYLYGYDLATPGLTKDASGNVFPASHTFSRWEDVLGNTAAPRGRADALYRVATGGPVTAYWAPNRHTVVLDGNGAEDMETYAVYGEEMRPYAPNADEDGWDEGRRLRAPSRPGYEFAGFWSTEYDESDESAHYFDADGAGYLTAVAGKTWDIVDPEQPLYAHWKYRIVLDANVHGFADSAGNPVEATIAWSSLPAGSGYEVVTSGQNAPYIEARAGAPVPMPQASREGYAPTRGWGLGLSSGANGKVDWVMRLTTDNRSAKLDSGALVAASPADASFADNGAPAGSTCTPQPSISDCTLTLYANWVVGDDAQEPDRSVVSGLGGGKNAYTVRLKATYATDDGKVRFVSDWADAGKTISGVEYDSPVSDSVLLALTAPAFVSATDHENLTFKGFYTEKNVPEEALKGVQLIAPSHDDATKLTGTANPMRLVPPAGSSEIVLYALWAMPRTDVVFHTNKSGLEAPLKSFSEAMDNASVLAKKSGSSDVFMVSPETNDSTPSIKGTGGMALPVANGNYVFNGWWTHPYLERGASVQYYDKDNNVVHSTWELYADTVLYAHWTYDISFEPSDGVLKVGLPKDKDGNYYDSCGNRYDFNEADEPGSGLANIHAILGAPVYLPEATKTGYDPTTDWGAGPTDDDGRTVDESVPPAPSKPDVTPGPDGKVTLNPVFDGKAHVLTVTLDAGSNAVDADGASWQNQVLTGVEFDKTLSASGIASVRVPLRDGYTFEGFSFGDDQYVNAAGSTLNKDWKVDSEDRKVTLSAQWSHDAYAVRYDLSAPNQGLSKEAGAGAVQGGATDPVDPWHCNAPVSHDGGDFKAPASDPNGLGTAKFYRNGYDFSGWYWLEDGIQRKVSDALGNPTGTFAPSLSWQQAHKGEPVTLYAEWTPKTYALVFDTNYQEQDAVAPSAPIEVTFGQTIVPFKDADGEAAIPTDAPFTFAGWSAPDGRGGSWTLFGSDAATAVSGAFTPAWPLSTLDKGNPGATRTITFTASWTSPKKVEVILSAGEHGTFSTSAFDRMRKTFVKAESNASKLVFRDVDYTDAVFDLTSARSELRPSADNGFTLLGFVKTNAEGFILDKNGTPTDAKSPYDNGVVREDVKALLTKELSKLIDDTYATAVYSADAMTVALDMERANVSYHAGYEAFELYDKVGDAYVKQASPKTTYAFDVREAPFKLPSEVMVPGFDFEGWVPATDVNAAPSKDVTVDPAAMARRAHDEGDEGLLHLTYYPRFSAKSYLVSFDPNYGSDKGMDATKSAIVDFEGRIIDKGSFDALKAGDILPIAAAPSPRTIASTTDGTYGSVPFEGWCVGSASDTEGILVKANTKPESSQWSAWIEEHASVEPGSRDQAELAVFALWVPGISATVPLTANVALDPDTARVAIVEPGYHLLGRNLGTSSLEVASLRYQSLKSDQTRGANAFALEGDAHAYLTVFANRAEAPSMGEPEIDDNGYVRGTYGTDEATLKFDLAADEAIYTKEELSSFGFAPFSTGAKRLKTHYGLSFDGVHIDKVRALRAKLPDVNGAIDERTWTVESIPVARLLYTVQLVEQ